MLAQDLLRIFTRQPQRNDFVACIGDFHLGAQHVHAEFFAHRFTQDARQLQHVIVAIAPDQHGRLHAPFRTVQAAELRAGGANLMNVVAQHILQESLRVLAGNAQRAELVQVAQHRVLRRCAQLGGNIAKMLH